jgi:hypothetical protein
MTIILTLNAERRKYSMNYQRNTRYTFDIMDWHRLLLT